MVSCPIVSFLANLVWKKLKGIWRCGILRSVAKNPLFCFPFWIMIGIIWKESLCLWSILLIGSELCNCWAGDIFLCLPPFFVLFAWFPLYAPGVLWWTIYTHIYILIAYPKKMSELLEHANWWVFFFFLIFNFLHMDCCYWAFIEDEYTDLNAGAIVLCIICLVMHLCRVLIICLCSYHLFCLRFALC